MDRPIVEDGAMLVNRLPEGIKEFFSSLSGLNGVTKRELVSVW